MKNCIQFCCQSVKFLLLLFNVVHFHYDCSNDDDYDYDIVVDIDYYHIHLLVLHLLVVLGHLVHSVDDDNNHTFDDDDVGDLSVKSV